MSDWKVGDIVIERRVESRQPVRYTPRIVRKVGRKYFYLDFGAQGWRNETKYDKTNGYEVILNYSPTSVVFKNVEVLRQQLLLENARVLLNKMGVRFDYHINPTLPQLLNICSAMECVEEVQEEVNKVLDSVVPQMVELEKQLNNGVVSL